MSNTKTENARKTEHKIDPIFVNRWSPRSMMGEEISDKILMSLFEAARWAPSSFNNQPWRFIYAKRKSNDWTKFLDLLNEGNKVWAKDAGALIVIISRKTLNTMKSPQLLINLVLGFHGRILLWKLQ
jgi:nitroreductase